VAISGARHFLRIAPRAWIPPCWRRRFIPLVARRD